MSSTDIVVSGADSPYAVLQRNPEELREIIVNTLGTDGLRMGDLDRIKVPAGGGTSWEVPGFGGTESKKEITGVILRADTRRTFWATSFDEAEEGEKPQCFSDDGLIGVGDPGGSCVGCAFNEFGTARNGVAKACQEMRQLFLLQPGAIIPVLVKVPPGSLDPFRKYAIRLLQHQLDIQSVVTTLKLSKETSRGNDDGKGKIDYAQIVFEGAGVLDPAARTRIAAVAEMLAPTMNRAAEADRDERDDLTGEVA